jgi:hypothetical protein
VFGCPACACRFAALPRMPNLCLGLLLGVILAWPAAGQNKSVEPRQIGFVLSKEGTWLANGQPIPGVGAGLGAKSVISLPPNIDFRSGQRYRLTIVLLNNRTIPLDCNSFETCRQQTRDPLPDSLAAPSTVVERVHQAVARLLFRDPDRYILADSRGSGPPQKIKEDVLLLNDGRLSIGAWFQSVEPGPYALALVYIGRDNRSGNPAALTFTWTGNRAATVDARDITPGLYQARLLPARSVLNQPVSQDAWVLVAAPTAYEKDAAAYRECTASTAGWTQVDPSEVQTFLRACLDQVILTLPDRPRR